jgi:hypothetical protein
MKPLENHLKISHKTDQEMKGRHHSRSAVVAGFGNSS